MPKVGMEPLRRRALIDAAIAAIGERGSLDVTMSDIAGRAGVSAALAHHYFGAKDQLLEATMRAILADLASEGRAALRGVGVARERLGRIVAVSFSDSQFRAEIVAAWLAFYVEAQRSPPLRRLLRIYARRLNSNLVDALIAFLPRERARHVAEGAAAMIDGLYIRRALAHSAPDAPTAISLVEEYFNLQLGESGFS
ncbi:MAG: transcriptional regulator BetI [Rhizobiaceae bacterium]|nr:transcriptional regulator BetI [Rhizobiaceae bacterium]MCV0405550.1 transcriptional regulator BetI [Rhizobiaceae bacterium]